MLKILLTTGSRNVYAERINSSHNIGFWKHSGGTFDAQAPYGKDGRWRWFSYDFDASFSPLSLSPFDLYAWNDDNPISGPPHYMLLPRMLSCDKFRDYFITRTADLMNSSFKTSRVAQRIYSFKNRIAPEIQRHLERWGTPYSYPDWEDGIDRLVDFASQRRSRLFTDMCSRFGLDVLSSLVVNVNDTAQGMVKVNTILINHDLPGTDPSLYPWTGDYFKNFPIALVAVAKPVSGLWNGKAPA
jgi:hypothetical protein